MATRRLAGVVLICVGSLASVATADISLGEDVIALAWRDLLSGDPEYVGARAELGIRSPDARSGVVIPTSFHVDPFGVRHRGDRPLFQEWLMRDQGFAQPGTTFSFNRLPIYQPGADRRQHFAALARASSRILIEVLSDAW